MDTTEKIPKRKLILLAAISIMQEQGGDRLTLDLVAKRAGVSKGGLLYHFPSKEALILGVVEEMTNSFETDVNTRIERDNQPEGRWSRAYIQATFEDSGAGNEMGSVLSSALFTNPELLQKIQTEYRVWQTNIENDGLDPVRSTIVRLAADGLWFAEMFGLAPPEPEFKQQILDELLLWTKEGK